MRPPFGRGRRVSPDARCSVKSSGCADDCERRWQTQEVRCSDRPHSLCHIPGRAREGWSRIVEEGAAMASDAKCPPGTAAMRRGRGGERQAEWSPLFTFVDYWRRVVCCLPLLAGFGHAERMKGKVAVQGEGREMRRRCSSRAERGPSTLRSPHAAQRSAVQWCTAHHPPPSPPRHCRRHLRAAPTPRHTSLPVRSSSHSPHNLLPR